LVKITVTILFQQLPTTAYSVELVVRCFAQSRHAWCLPN